MAVRRKLEEAAKAMVTSLPLVSKLRHPAMRHRHWRQLMKVTLEPPPHSQAAILVKALLLGPQHLSTSSKEDQPASCLTTA